MDKQVVETGGRQVIAESLERCAPVSSSELELLEREWSFGWRQAVRLDGWLYRWAARLDQPTDPRRRPTS